MLGVVEGSQMKEAEGNWMRVKGNYRKSLQ